jgi:uncharacterized protein (TIGR03435 family)
MRVDRPVLDRTGLTGTFAIDFEFTSGNALPAAAGGTAAGSDAGPPAGTVAFMTGPSIFTALTEQLGLRLESRKEPIDVLVIDRLEMPTPN